MSYRWSKARKQKARATSKRIARDGTGNAEWKALGSEIRKPTEPVKLRITPADVLRQTGSVF